MSTGKSTSTPDGSAPCDLQSAWPRAPRDPRPLENRLWSEIRIAKRDYLFMDYSPTYCIYVYIYVYTHICICIHIYIYIEVYIYILCIYWVDLDSIIFYSHQPQFWTLLSFENHGNHALDIWQSSSCLFSMHLHMMICTGIQYRFGMVHNVFWGKILVNLT